MDRVQPSARQREVRWVVLILRKGCETLEVVLVGLATLLLQ